MQMNALSLLFAYHVGQKPGVFWFICTLLYQKRNKTPMPPIYSNAYVLYNALYVSFMYFYAFPEFIDNSGDCLI